MDGTGMSYTHWDVGQPDNYMNQENCIQVYKYYRPGVDVQPYFAWNDNDCSLHCSFVCEKEAIVYDALPAKLHRVSLRKTKK